MNELDVLAIKAQNGDTEALNELFEKVEITIRKFVMKLNFRVEGSTKEDLYQTAGEYFVKAVHSYDASRGEFIHHLHANVKSGLITVMNKANNYRNKVFKSALRLNVSVQSDRSNGEVEVQDYIVCQDVLGYRATDEEFHYHEDIETVQKVAEEILTTYQKQVLYLWMEGKSYKEGAELLGKSEKSIDNATHKAKSKMRKYFELNKYKELI